MVSKHGNKMLRKLIRHIKLEKKNWQKIRQDQILWKESWEVSKMHKGTFCMKILLHGFNFIFTITVTPYSRSVTFYLLLFDFLYFYQ